MTNKFDELTLKEIKELMNIFGKTQNKQDECLWEVGKIYFIRTVTMNLIGKVEKVTEKEILLSSASWIADSGRWHDALKTGKLNEVEPYVSDVIVGRSALIDATEWKHSVKLEQK